MSDRLSATVGGSVVTTTQSEDGTCWVTLVQQGALDGYKAVMDIAGDPAVQHANVIEDVKARAAIDVGVRR